MTPVVGKTAWHQRTGTRRAIGAVVFLLVWCAVVTAHFLPRGSSVQPPAAVPVSAGRPVHSDFPVHVVAVGTVTPLNVTDVKVRVDGQLQKLAFTEGEEVKTGQVLAQLDAGPIRAQLAQAEATMHKDQASLVNARLDLQRYTKLGPLGAATAQMVDAARAKVDELVATVAADQALVQNDQLQLGFTTLVAPFDGRVGAKEADVGSIVRTANATGVVTVTQMAPIDVQFSVPQDVLGDVLDRQKAGPLPVTVTAHSGGATLAQGSLVFIDTHVDPASGQVMLKALFRNLDRKLWPGELVDARLLLQTKAARLAVPSRAILHTQDGAKAYVVNANGTVQLRPVQVGISVDGMTEVESGILDTDVVVFDGQSRLNPGVQVAPTMKDAKAEAAASAGTSQNAETSS